MSSENAASAMISWDQDLRPDLAVSVEAIENFNARGMHSVYGRGDHFDRPKPVFHLDLWTNREGRFLARFWSRSQDVDWESWEVIGLTDTDFPTGDERWVPQCLRQCYDSWVMSNV